MQRFENRHLIPHLGQIRCTGQPRRATADNGHLVSVRSGSIRSLHLIGMFQRPIPDETLHLANRHRLALDTENTGTFALRLLRTNPAANRRQGTVLGNHRNGSGQIARRQLGDKLWYLHRYRTMVDTAGLTAMQAARSFQLCLLQRIAVTHLFEIGDPHLRVLFPYGNASYLVCHLSFSGYLSNPMLQACPWARSSAMCALRLSMVRYIPWRRIASSKST